jgi:aminopeptidase N
MRSRPDAAQHVDQLMRHEDFSLGRPNRVRALIGAFAGMNQTGFNAASGAGYDLVAGVVMQLDKRNPQVAARMAGSFRSYQLMERGRRDKARAALARIAAMDGLSRDTAEMVSRMLA